MVCWAFTATVFNCEVSFIYSSYTHTVKVYTIASTGGEVLKGLEITVETFEVIKFLVKCQSIPWLLLLNWTIPIYNFIYLQCIVSTGARAGGCGGSKVDKMNCELHLHFINIQ